MTEGNSDREIDEVHSGRSSKASQDVDTRANQSQKTASGSIMRPEANLTCMMGGIGRSSLPLRRLSNTHSKKAGKSTEGKDDI
ncbi:hypothetical protein PM082_009393 [Marasmius tenuissimus]|nr:hypothetical protein PM082_009393 [Marasmius tenuissimus]